LLAKGEIVARCSGRVEWGPRALGNRSILGDPRDLRVIGKVNFAIKKRDFWMPFAASILEKRMDDYLVDAKFAPYMIEAFDTTEKVDDIIAGTHPKDKTARPQIVNEWNPGYKKIIETFEAKTGVGSVLNTSFNVHGYPLIGTPDVAIDTLKNSGLKWLALGNYLVKK
jgi:carbamoyltransferase